MFGEQSFAVKGSLLHLAAAYGDISRCQQLITERPEMLREIDEDKRCPLHIAAIFGHAPVIELFFNIASGIALDATNISDIYGQIPLHYAVQNNHLAACEALVEFIDKVIITWHSRYFTCPTPYEVACKAGHLEIIMFFLKKGVPLNRDCFQAIGKSDKRFETIKFLLAVSTSNIMTNLDLLLLHSCKENDTKSTKLLLDAGADPYCQRDVVGCQELFLERAYNMTRHHRGLKYTILNYSEALVLLQDHDIIWSGTDHLNERINYENAECIHLLLESGIDFDTHVLKYHRIIRSMVLLCANADVVSMLMDRMDDIKPSLMNPMVKRLLQSKEEDKAIAIMQQYYRPKKKQAHRWLRMAAYHNCLEFVNCFLDHYELDVDDVAPSGRLDANGVKDQTVEVTAFSIAVQRGHKQIAHRLVAEGADIDRIYSIPAQPLSSSPQPTTATFTLKLTLLMISCAHGKLEEVKLLLSLGARVNIQDELQGDIAFYFALRSCDYPEDFLTQKHHEIPELRLMREEQQRRTMTRIVVALLAAGADLTIANEDGETPLEIVERCGNLRLLAAMQSLQISCLKENK